jgi:hypothetical protein
MTLLHAQRAFSGERLRVYFLTGDPRCTAEDGLEAWVVAQKNPADAAEDFFERLKFIARHAESTRSDWFERMQGRQDIWAVRKKRLRLYGFMVDDCLYLCTHDPCKKQNRADQRVLDRTEDLRDD